jgi:2-polyprenyl-3-methyl-5-hydroxy-6-metoxy-1,4-benzoquinol methylase
MGNYKDYGWEEGSTDAHGFLYYDLKYMIGPDKAETILDVGCGNGAMANTLIGEGYDVYGIDASISGIEVANRENSNRFFVQDIDSIQLPDELHGKTFNKIISTEVIEHLYSPRSYVKFLKTILINNDSGGEVIISTPYHGYFKNLALAITGKMDQHFTVLWDGGHIKFWSIKTLTNLLEESGFQIVEFRGSGRFPYLWKSMFIKAKID